jgi:hypothetical protein
VGGTGDVGFVVHTGEPSHPLEEMGNGAQLFACLVGSGRPLERERLGPTTSFLICALPAAAKSVPGMVDDEDVGERLEGLLGYDAVLHARRRSVGVVLELEGVGSIEDLRLELDEQSLRGKETENR